MFAAHQGWENSPMIALNSNLTLNFDELSSQYIAVVFLVLFLITLTCSFGNS